MSRTAYQRVCITGGSSGIGLALACHYAAQGADVALIARDPQKLTSARERCLNACSRPDQRIEIYPLDVADRQSLPGLMSELVNQFGSPDLLILSAGVASGSRFSELSSDQFDRVMEINFYGSKEVVKELLPSMLEQPKAQIVLISSLAGLISAYGYSAYCASKHAVVGLAGALRQELAAKGIGVTLVCPGEVDTPMVEQEATTILPQTRLLKDVGGTLAVEQVVKSIVAGVARNKALVVPGFRAGLAYRLSRWLPGIFAHVTQWLLKSLEK